MGSAGALPFAGRRPDQTFLQHQLELTRAEGVRLVLLTGPAGIGKTALARHFLQGLDGTCTWGDGRGWDNRAAVPYHAVREAMQRLLSNAADGPGLASAVRCPHLQLFLDGHGGQQIAGLPPDLLFHSLGVLLAAWARPALCLFLDDLQWADEGTFDWIDYCLRELQSVPVLLLAAARSEDRDSLLAFLEHCEPHAREGRLKELCLAPLDETEVAQLARATVPAHLWQDDLPQRLWRRSGGVPLMLLEEIRALPGTDEIHPSGRTLISTRIARLAQEDRSLLEQAAVLGERFDVETLAGALEEDDLTVARRLDGLGRDGMLIPDGARFRFAHSRYREALLAQMSDALRRAYHVRATAQTEATDAAAHTYHLVHSGDGEAAVQALIKEADSARDLLDWRDALRYYHEALAHTWTDPAAAPRWRRVLCQRLGDLHREAVNEPEIARGYYEAAMAWVDSPAELVPLLCRLTETYGESPRGIEYLERAAQLAAQAGDSVASLWVEFLQTDLTSEPRPETQSRLTELGRSLWEEDRIPTVTRQRAWDISLQVPGASGLEPEIAALSRRLEELPAGSWSAACQHVALATVYMRLGAHRTEIETHLMQALEIFRRLGRHGDIAPAQMNLAIFYRNRSRYVRARELLIELLQDSRCGPRHAFYSQLCETWIWDEHPDGARWVDQLFDAWSRFLTTHEHGTDALQSEFPAQEFGPAERILRTLKGPGAFRQRLDAWLADMAAAGYRTAGVWSLGDGKEREPIEAADLSRDWRQGPEEKPPPAAGEDIELTAAAYTGFIYMTMPRITREVEGDFSLQVTIHDGSRVLADFRDCCHEAGQGRQARLAAGGGGLLLVLDRQNAVRLFAHVKEAGEVVFESRLDGKRRTLGRGLVDDGPLRLRMERRGDHLEAFVASAQGLWYSCGQVELPAQTEVTAGIYAECPTFLYSDTESVRTRFRDLRFQGESRARRVPGGPPALFPRPAVDSDPELAHIVAASPGMRQVLAEVRRAAATDTSVLITGETGTGKELVARALHQLSWRRDGPFIPVNCAAVAGDLLERELFGHVRGAFTGAFESRGGLFEAAHQGVLLLDEVGDASLAFQARLLRVVEEGAVRPVGSQRLHRVDVRLVAATHRDIHHLVDDHAFRPDVYYRLAGARIHIPPLRDRREDIPPLVFHVLDTWARRSHRAAPQVTRAAMTVLIEAAWRGNVRELVHVVEQAAAAAGDQAILPAHLPLAAPPPASASRRRQPGADRSVLCGALREAGGNVTAAARRLGMSRSTFYRQMRKLGIQHDRSG